MPELPDLEVFKENVYKKLTSKRLVSVNVYNHQKVTTPQGVLLEELKGRELTAINRYGKELFFDFKEGRIITAHLMLNGKISIVNDANAAANIKFKIFSLNFEKESIIFSDMGGLCTIKYKPVSDGVPDALGTDFTLKYFINIARKKANVNIKAFLINQKVVKGIGNAYVDEILWCARISPHSKVGKIPEEVMVELYNAINTVLKEAIISIKAIAPNIISGEERSFLHVHNKSKKQTETGFPIIIERIASKTTYFTEEQILYR
jgi:formamidopyrimidine-DNA glycosylase